MALEIPVGFVRQSFIVSARGPSQQREVTFSYSFEDSTNVPPIAIGSPAFLNALRSYFTDRWDDTVAGAFSNDTELIGFRVQWNDGSVVIPAESGHVGDNAGALFAPEAAYIVRLYTATPGRKGRGRTFLPDVFEDAVDPAGYVTNFTPHSAWAEFLGSLDDILDPTATDFERGLNGVHILHSDNSAPSRVTAFAPAPRLGWLRRRGR